MLNSSHSQSLSHCQVSDGVMVKVHKSIAKDYKMFGLNSLGGKSQGQTCIFYRKCLFVATCSYGQCCIRSYTSC